MKNRIVNNYKSTIIGILLIIATFVLVFFEKVTWSEFAAFAPFCIGLILVKDDSFKGKTPMILLFVSISVLFTSCVSYEKCVEKYGVVRNDTMYVETVVRDTISVLVPADSNVLVFNIDSLAKIIRGKVFKEQDSTSKIQLSYWIDNYNKLHIKAFKPPDTIYKPVEIPVKVPCPPVFHIEKKLTWYQEFWEWYKNFSAFALMLSIAILTVILIKR